MNRTLSTVFTSVSLVRNRRLELSHGLDLYNRIGLGLGPVNSRITTEQSEDEVSRYHSVCLWSTSLNLKTRQISMTRASAGIERFLNVRVAYLGRLLRVLAP